MKIFSPISRPTSPLSLCRKMIFRTAFPRSPQVSSPIALFSKFGIARTLMLLSILFNTRVARSFSSSSSYQDRSPTSSSLQNLLKSGFTLTLTDFTEFLLFLSQNRRFKYAIQFFSQMNSNQIEGDSRACSIFTWALLKEHKFDEAERFMKTQMRKRPNFPENCMWDSLIQGLCKNDPEKGLLILRDCLRINGMSPSPLTFCSLFYAFCSRGMMSQAIEALELMNSEKSKYPLDNFVCSSIIAGFCRTGKPEIAVRFYENAESSGAFRPSLVTCTAIVSALCKLGRFDEVSGLARKMESAGLSFDVIFYSCWICGYFREGILVEAFQRYREMVGRAISPDTISYTILIDGLSKDGNVEKAVGFLNKMMKDGLKPNLVTYTAIMSGFCKKGKLEEACAVFRLAEDLGIKVDEFMYATIIDGFSRRGDFGRVYSLLDEMEKKGINPSIVTYNTVINGLCKCGRTSEANEVSKGIPVDIFTYCTLLHGYIKEVNFMGILETKRKMEEAGVRLDVIMCNILIKALFLVGDPEAAYEIYKGFPEINLVADSVTYCTMLDGYCKLSNMDKALEIFDDFRKTSISSIACYRCIIYWFCMKGMLDMATAVFSELTEKGLDLDFSTYKLLIKVIFKGMGVEGVLNLVDRIEYLKEETTDVMFNYAIYFLCKRCFVEAACNVCMVMRIKGSAPTCKSYYSILTGLIGDGKKWLSRLFLGAFLKEFGFTESKVSKILVRYLCMKDINSAIHFLDNLNKKALPVTFPVTILKMLSNDGRALDAYELVMAEKDCLPVIDVVDYSIIVDGLCKGGHFIKALDLCAFAKKKGITFNIVTYNSVINGLCRQGCLVQALRLFDSFEKIDLVPSEITYATLVDALCKEGYVSEAKKLFERMILKGLDPNTRVYNSLINHYCKINQLEKAWKLLLDLEARCLKPDGFTLSSMINGYCHRGDLEGALEFFYEFKRKDLLPDFLGFVRLMRGLCTKGRMEEARTILREMLAAQSVVELLEKVDFEVEPDSMKSVLVFLCEQGSIQEAITVLNEVGCRFFPVKTRSSSFSGSQKLRHPNESEASGTVDLRSGTSYYEIDLDSGMHGATKEEIPENYDNLWKKSQNHDFNSCYSIIGSLCSRGELQKANMLVKDMISNLNRGC